MGFSGLRAFGSRFSILIGGQERSPKTQPFHILSRYQMKTKILLLLTLLIVSYGCKKDEINAYCFNCKINQQKWIAEKYESLLSNKQVLSAGAYYDPNSRWIQIWGDRSIVDQSQDYGYMQGCICINIAGFNGAGIYPLMEYPFSGYGNSVLLQNWASSEVIHPDIHYPCSIKAYTTVNSIGSCTITKFDSINLIIEGEFSFNANHQGCDLVVSITNGKFSLKYEREDINNQMR